MLSDSSSSIFATGAGTGPSAGLEVDTSFFVSA
jgi:hypothetical protein